jgi:hypothetical protein|tara:strand:+ start:805 stop:1299 length:495 start_codon:yes stop_codon:yes gene_type:complete
MKIISNFLDKQNFLELKENMLGSYFPWFLAEGVVKPGDNQYQFIHNFYKANEITSPFYKLLLPTLDKIKLRALIRIKANLIYKTQKIIEHGFHIDNPISKTSKQKTAILYINTNNGYTKFKKLKVNSEENKMIIFNSKEEHTGSSCTDQEFRVVINFNYYDTNS